MPFSAIFLACWSCQQAGQCTVMLPQNTAGLPQLAGQGSLTVSKQGDSFTALIMHSSQWGNTSDPHG